tara:strand:- start:6763 stop:7140 length:378 start_codon:yes stop_codon:yes gene_type:complete
MAWQDEYLEKAFHMYIKDNTYNDNWTHYYSYADRELMRELTELSGTFSPSQNYLHHTRLTIDRNNISKVLKHVLLHPDNLAHKNFISNLKKITKRYMHLLVYKERKVKYNEMVLQMDNNTTESNS